MSCKVLQCNFSDSHTTKGHKCGRCGQYGLGVLECRSEASKQSLVQYWNEELPNEKQCSLNGCSHSWSHSKESHNCSKCGIRGRHSIIDCPIRPFNPNGMGESPNIEDDMNGLDNVYIVKNIGMGCCIFIRKKNNVFESLFMHSDSWGQYGQETDDTPIFNSFVNGMEEIPYNQPNINDLLLPHEFISSNIDNTITDIPNINAASASAPNLIINKLIKCPLCRTENTKSIDIKEIKGLSDKCSVCYENNVTKYFSQCEHACVCTDCYEKLN